MRRRVWISFALIGASIVGSGAAAQEPLVEPAPGAAAEATEAEASPAEREARLRTEAGTLAMQQGRLDEAQSDFARACALAPTAERWLALAQVQEALRMDRELRSTYRAFLEAAPEHPRAAEIRARAAILERTPPPTAPAPASGAGVAASVAAAARPSPPAEQRDLFDEPWFWGVVAVVVGGGIVAALFLSGDQGTEDPIAGDDGVIVRTLIEAP